jgi:hypothetical protein
MKLSLKLMFLLIQSLKCENFLIIFKMLLTLKMRIIIIKDTGGIQMKKILVLSTLLFVLLNQFMTNQAFAYSYGDPNEEIVAERYKEMLIKLDENPPNFAEAKKIYESVQEEVDMHMGPKPSEIILKNLEDEDKENAIKNMDELLVLNIARRLESIEKNFDEFDTSKKLLAKGFATYEALSPKIESENPELDKNMKQEFDKALQSLGNPGLFGVGEQKSDIEAFKKSKEQILTTLQEHFDIKSLEVGHFSESATEVESNSGKKEWTDLSNLKNWVPIIILVGLLAGVIVFTVNRKRKNR